MTMSNSKSKHFLILKKYDQVIDILMMQIERKQNYSKAFSFDLFAFVHILVDLFDLD